MSPRLFVFTALLALLSAVAPALAEQRSCRVCDCTMTISSDKPMDVLRYKETLAIAMQDRNGGGGFNYKVEPKVVSGQWQSEIHVPRLCGNGGEVHQSFQAPTKDKQGNPIKNIVIFSCSCHPSVRCLGETHCERSGL